MLDALWCDRRAGWDPGNVGILNLQSKEPLTHPFPGVSISLTFHRTIPPYEDL